MPRGRRLFYWAALINFVLFVAGTFVLGGDALNGHVDGGHYFVGSHHHFTEVSRAAYWYSAIHALSVVVTLPIAAVMALSARAYLKRR